jgi:glycosyltransferase involved in cell wall biosynthesis
VTLLASAALFLMASVREGWGLVVTEANSVGTPAIVYDRPGLRDSTLHEQTGLLTDPSPQALAAGIRRALMDTTLYHSLSAGAAAWSAEFTWSRSNEQFEHALHTVAERRPLASAAAEPRCAR